MPQIGTGRAAPWADRRAETSKARRQVTVEATSWSGAFEAAMRAALWGWTLARRRSACEAACRRSHAIAKRQNEEQKKRGPCTISMLHGPWLREGRTMASLSPYRYRWISIGDPPGMGIGSMARCRAGGDRANK